MFLRKGRQILGIIIDFDLAKVTNIHSTLYRENHYVHDMTGTLPFMAMDRLKMRDPTHWPRHDLESIFWGIVLFTSRYDKGHLIKKPPFRLWYRLQVDQLAAEKWMVLHNLTTEHKSTPSFERLKHAWIFPLSDLLIDGLLVRERANRDRIEMEPETLGGFVTHEKFLKIMKKNIPVIERYQSNM